MYVYFISISYGFYLVTILEFSYHSQYVLYHFSLSDNVLGELYDELYDENRDRGPWCFHTQYVRTRVTYNLLRNSATGYLTTY